MPRNHAFTPMPEPRITSPNSTGPATTNFHHEAVTVAGSLAGADRRHAMTASTAASTATAKPITTAGSALPPTIMSPMPASDRAR